MKMPILRIGKSGDKRPLSSRISGACRLGLLPSSLVALLVLPATLSAQEGDDTKTRRVIEEVIVSAQKREQVSQKVPISMSVMSDVFIQEQGIVDVAEALKFVPNFKIVEYGNIVSPQCRGFTVSEGNPSFEAPCGFALDGVAFSRGAYFSAGLFDLKRMEVLRGPQGTTFGKNTTAGVVSLYSKDPTEEFAINMSLQYGLEGVGQTRGELGIGGPIIEDVVLFRLAGVKEDRDGFMENTYHQTDPSVDEEVGQKERTTYRAKLTFPNVMGADVKLLHEKTELYAGGFSTKVIPLNEAWADFIRSYDPNADFGENYKTSNLGANAWTDTKRTQIDINAEWNAWGFTAVAATGELVNVQKINAFPAPVPFAYSERNETSPFKTAELRTISPDFDGLLGLDSLFGVDLGSSSFLLGAFWQEQELENLSIAADVYYAGIVGAVGASVGLFLPTSTVEQVSNSLFGNPGPSESFLILFDQVAETKAIFGQLTWNMNERWTMDLGARFSEEEKEAHWDVSYSMPAPLLNPTGDRGYVKDKSLSNFSIQPKVSLGYEVQENINVFVHWAKGFKSGGFNAYTSTGDPERPNQTNPDATVGSLEYGDESVTDIGIDLKMKLLNDQMLLNISLFRMDVEEFQVLTEVLGSKIPGTGVRVPNGYQQVVNAGKARAQGAEIDLTYLATNWLTVISAIGYNDTEYLSFPLDNCGPEEEPDADTGKCDHTGYEFLGTPKLSGTLTLDAKFPLAGLWEALGESEFHVGGTVEYTGAQFAGNYNADNRTDAEYSYRAHLGVSNPAQGWNFRVSAINLTDEYSGFSATDRGLGVKTMSPFPPRTVIAQFGWSY